MKPLRVGDPAPDFVVKGEDTLHGLIEQRRCPALVYFYPKDFSPVCTAQACMLRDMQASARDEDEPGLVIGISGQSEAEHDRFRAARGLPQLLVSDESGEIAQAFGVRGFLGITKRVSFTIGTDLRITRASTGLLSLARHRDHARDYFASL